MIEGDIFMYQTEQETRDGACYLQLEGLAMKLCEDADKTVAMLVDRLAPIMSPPRVVDEIRQSDMVEVQEQWPPHFATMRQRISKVSENLIEIRQLIDSTGL